MVLTRTWALLALVLLGGCLKRVPTVRLAQPTPVAVAYVADRREAPGGEVSEELMARVEEVLATRNLAPVRLPREGYATAFEKVRTTPQRLAQVAAQAGAAPLVLLVEVKPVFYDLLSGRFKWTVYTKLTLASRTDLPGAMSDESNVGVFLQFDRQREVEAQAQAAGSISERAGVLSDTFLGDRPEFPQGAPQAKRVGPGDAIYFVMVDRYANGDRGNDADASPADPAGFHGGDLQGVLDHLDDIQRLGFTAVWLSPVWKMRTDKFFGHGAFHGYWVDDFAQVEPRFGDRRLLRRLSDELHRRKMKLVLDVVLNHVSFDSPLVKQKPAWFHHRGEIKDWNDRAQLENNDVMGLPDLAQENEEVYRYLLEASERWIDEVRPDGFRLDAVKHVPLAFWARYNRDIHAHAGADFWLLGEALEGDPARVAQVWREGGFDAMFDFPLYYAITDVFCKGAPVGRLAATLSQDRVYPDASQLVTLVDNHDLPRLMTACGGDRARAEQALRFLFLSRGVPSVTYGTEVGLAGEKEPENRGDMRFGEPPLAPIAELMQLRQRHPALAGGRVRISSAETQTLGLLQISLSDSALIAVGLQGAPVEARMPPVCEAFELGSDAVQVQALQKSSREVVLVAAGKLPKKCVDWASAGQRQQATFALSGAPAGASVVVVGAGPELGNWDPKHGLGPLTEKGGKLALGANLPEGAVYEFKFVARRADGSVEWENRPDRFLFVSGEGPAAVDARWSEP